MSKEVTWVKVESKSHPGRCYYYDRVSKASTWERPPELRDLEIPSHPGGKGKVRRQRSCSEYSGCTVCT